MIRRTLLMLSILGTAPFVVQAADDAEPIKALLVIGGCCHDYDKQKDLLTKGISAAPMCSGSFPMIRTPVPST